MRHVFEEAKHVVHGCALRDLGRMCMDVREAQTCDATLEQVSKSRQTHEHCVAEDLVLKRLGMRVLSWRGMLRVVALPSCPLCLLDIDEQVVD